LLSIDEQDKALPKAIESGDTYLAEGGCREGKSNMSSSRDLYF